MQSENAFLDVAQRVNLMERLAAAGYTRIEAVSFVHPRAIPQMRDAAEVMAAVPRRPGVTYIALVPNEVGTRSDIAAHVDELATVVSASETHNPSNVNRSVAETLEIIGRVGGYGRGGARALDGLRPPGTRLLLSKGNLGWSALADDSPRVSGDLGTDG